MRRPLRFLHDMVAAIDSATGFIGEADYAQFCGDMKAVYAVAHATAIIGEAVRGVPAPVRERFPGIPWRQLAAMRNRLIHAYFETEARFLWHAVRTLFPQLRADLERVIAELEQSQGAEP